MGNDWHRPKLESIARTILQRKLSLTALQEVSSKDAVEHLASELTRQDDNAVWRQRVSGDLRRSSDGVAEYAAFLWKPAVNKVGGVNLWSDHVAEGSDSVYRLHTIPLSLKRSPFYGLFSLNGHPVLFVNCHIRQSKPEDEIRQLLALVGAAAWQNIDAWDEIQVLVVGDFNLKPKPQV